MNDKKNKKKLSFRQILLQQEMLRMAELKQPPCTKFSGLSSRERTHCITFCAMMAALSVVFMLMGGLVPVFTYCSPVLASVMLLPVLLMYGTVPAVLTWVVSSALVLLLGADKEAAFFYLFLGWYPVAKRQLDRIPFFPLRLGVKIALLTAAVAAMYGVTCFLFQIDEIVSSFSVTVWINIVFLAALVLVMLLFDILLTRLTYICRVRFLKNKTGRRVPH